MQKKCFVVGIISSSEIPAVGLEIQASLLANIAYELLPHILIYPFLAIGTCLIFLICIYHRYRKSSKILIIWVKIITFIVLFIQHLYQYRPEFRILFSLIVWAWNPHKPAYVLIALICKTETELFSRLYYFSIKQFIELLHDVCVYIRAYGDIISYIMDMQSVARKHNSWPLFE